MIKRESIISERVISYFRNKPDEENDQVIDDGTAEDLDFDQLFERLDKTKSRVGQQYLYDRLRRIPLNHDHYVEEEKVIAEFLKNEALKIKTEKLLGKLNKEGAFHISSLIQDEYISPPKWFFITNLLSLLGVLSLGLLIIEPRFIMLFLTVCIINLIIHYWNKKNLYYYLQSLPQLVELNRIAESLSKDSVFSNLNLAVGESISAINKIKPKMRLFQLDAGLQGDFQVFFWSVLEMVKIAFLLEPRALFKILRVLDEKRTEIENVFKYVGQIDSLQSIAELRKELNTYCIPVISDSGSQFEVEGMYHPLIENCVPNNIDVGDRSILLTGSNMSGKTTFIRSVAINVITGLTINTCFASSMAFSRLRVFSAIRISDDLLNNKSYYFEEVLKIKIMLDRSQDNQSNLFLLDELFKGTNTVERVSAGKAVLSALAKGNNLVFVSTHDIELTDLLKDEYDLYHFSEIVQDEQVHFDYKLKKGKASSRNAIKILELNDYPKEVISEAMQLAKSFDELV